MNTLIVKWYYEFCRNCYRVLLRAGFGKRDAGRERFDIGAVNKILIVNTGLIGDTVMSVPVFSEVRRLFPRARICGLVSSRLKDLLGESGYFDEFLVYDHSVFPLNLCKRKEMKLLEKRLQEFNFDLAVITLGDDFSVLLHKARIPVRVGVQGSNFDFLLTHLYSIGAPHAWGPDERLNSLRSLGLDPLLVAPQIVVPASSADELSTILKAKGVQTDKKIVLIHPYGSSLRQWWPMANVTALSRFIKDIFDVELVLIGSNKERQCLNSHCEEAEGRRSNPSQSLTMTESAAAFTDLRGALSLSELCALIKSSALVVTTDSGPMHLAGALQRPVVGLFRAIRPEHKSRYTRMIAVQWQEGEDCLKKCKWDHCQKIPCCQMTGITPKMVFNEVAKYLKEAKS